MNERQIGIKKMRNADHGDKSRADALTVLARIVELDDGKNSMANKPHPERSQEWKAYAAELPELLTKARAILAASPVEQPAQLTAQDALAAIETFEIVGDNNDSREPNADDRFILTEFIAHAFGGYPVKQPAAAPIVSAPASDARECLMDVVSHHHDFVTACKSIKGELHACGAHDSAAYWQKQIDVLDRMKAQAERALATSANETGAEGLLRRAREELSQVEWEFDPPNRVVALFDDIEAYVSRSPAMAAAAPADETPKGCTPADAWMLREANHALAAENDALRRALRPFARVVSTDKLSWAMVEYCVEGDPEKQTFQAPQMQRAFNRAADILRAEPSQPAAAPADERAAFVKVIGYERPDTDGVAQDAWDSQRATWLEALEYARAAASPAAEAVPDDCDVRKILLNVVPGMDGEGHEVCARNVADVEQLLSEMGERLDAFESTPQPAPADAPAEACEPIAWVTDDDRAITAAQKQRALADGGATASSVRPYSIPCYAISAPADAGEAREPIGPHDLSTTAGGRSYVAEFFAKRLRRHDFGRYITGQLAADFACSLAAYLRDHDHAAADAGEAVGIVHRPARNGAGFSVEWLRSPPGGAKLYTAPPAARVASLTDEQHESIEHAATWLGRSEDLQNKAHAKRLCALLNGDDQ